MKATQFKYNRKLPIYGVHPIGGFVAWPEGRIQSEEEKKLAELLKRRRERRGFVAWPEK